MGIKYEHCKKKKLLSASELSILNCEYGTLRYILIQNAVQKAAAIVVASEIVHKNKTLSFLLKGTNGAGTHD